ncbi:hypothetical protein EW026_g3296 [Hermanssonia centrifuga]|uniref:SNF7 family protein n=1 Tax=Hermanssonia centrifuga TaxID=98765 RepID=A0A4S4KLN6_9APHY|nr:hypothetical protein EW026_g3296 [Hermanssonia centrifuga]
MVGLIYTLRSTPSIYDAGWLPYRIASYVVGKPLWWALQQLSIVGADDFSGHGGDTERWKKVRGDYVVLSLLERAGDGVLQKQQSKTGVSLSEELYDFDGFKREFAGDALDGVVLSELDVKVLLKYLERDKKAIVVQDEVIKFVQPNQSREITAVDIGVLELKIAVEDLEASVSKIQQQIDDRSEKISAALRQKRKEVALSHLRTKKQFEDLLKKRLTSLETLHSTLLRVEASAGDVEIMKSYESSAATLRAILAHPLLQRDRIDETMDAMASANADARDIDEAIRIGTDVAQAETGIDDAELEAELNALVKDVEGERAKEQEERALQERQEQLDGLTVPEHVARSPERADPSKVVA